MIIRDVSSQFTVYVFSTDLEKGAEVKVFLSRAQYQVFYFSTLEDLKVRLHEVSPHVLIVFTNSLEGKLSEFVEVATAQSDEIKLILVTDLTQFESLTSYAQVGVADIVSSSGESLEQRVLWSLDRTCENLYLTYQNEQLFEKLQQAEAAQRASLELAQSAQQKVITNLETSVRINEYMSASTKEQILQIFMNHLGSFSCLYFKFLPTVRSFVVTHSHHFAHEQVQGVGVQLSIDEMKDLENIISLGILPPSFSNMLHQAFAFSPAKAWPLYAGAGLEGVVVYSGSLESALVEQASEEFSIMRLSYSHFSLEKKVDVLEVLDPVTEVFNAHTYKRIVTEEFERARRLKHPLSLVKISIDDFLELEQVIGKMSRDALLKSLAQMISKTSRTHDKTARTGLNEISMILPHCSKKGAAVRAERVRRMIESSQLIENGIKISVSLGVSEYPTLCSAPEELDQTAYKAMMHIFEKGGNKICLFKALPQHEPDFQVEAE